MSIAKSARLKVTCMTVEHRQKLGEIHLHGGLVRVLLERFMECGSARHQFVPQRRQHATAVASSGFTKGGHGRRLRRKDRLDGGRGRVVSARLNHGDRSK